MTEVGLVVLRVSIGVTVACLHGWHKVGDGWRYLAGGADWPLLDDTTRLGVPWPVLFTALAAASQSAGAALLALGAATRWSAFMVSGTMLGAVAFNVKTGGPDVQLAALYALVTGVFVAIGGGWWSVDRVLGESRT